jgi:hypothetical protein
MPEFVLNREILRRLIRSGRSELACEETVREKKLKVLLVTSKDRWSISNRFCYFSK